MYSTIQSLHSYFAYAALAAIIISTAIVLFKKINKNHFTASVHKIALFGFIACHIQLLLGLILYFISPIGLANLSGETMKDSTARLHAVEHPFAMLLGIILISMGYLKAKKQIGDDKGFNTILIYYILGLILILSRIPWTAWLAQ